MSSDNNYKTLVISIVFSVLLSTGIIMTVPHARATTSSFNVGDTVGVIGTFDSGLSMRDSYGLSSTKLKVVPDAWAFIITGGSIYMDGYTWWKVQEQKYEASTIEGWVAENFLIKVSPEILVPTEAPAYFSTNQDEIYDAIVWAMAQEGKSDWSGYCLKFVREAFNGEIISGWASAEAAIQQLEEGGKFYSWVDCWNPPVGALIFFSALGEYEPYGHVGIYLGNQGIVHSYGTVRVDTIEDGKNKGIVIVESLNMIGSYIGWAYPPEEWLEPAVTDTTQPTVNSLSVEPVSIILGDSVTISYSVSDTGGSGLNRVELWRRSETEDWQEINRNSIIGIGNGPYSSYFSDIPPSTGTYWFGIHVVDNAGNWAPEDSPINVEVTTISYSISGVVYYSTTPLVGVQVDLWDILVTDPLVRTTYSDSEGYYCFSSVDPGSYRIKRYGPTDEYIGWVSSLIEDLSGDFTRDLYMPKVLTLLSPENGADVTSLHPTLTWEANPEAAYYWIQVNVKDTWELVEQEMSESTEYTIYALLSPGVEYAWDVYAADAVGHLVGITQTAYKFTCAEVSQLIESVDISVYYDYWEYYIQTNIETQITWYIYNCYDNLVHTYAFPSYSMTADGIFGGYIPDGGDGYIHLKVVSQSGDIEWWPSESEKYMINRPPPIPHGFYGDVTIDGLPAPDGLMVSTVLLPAYDDYFTLTYTSGGTYGWDEPFQVPPDDPNTPEIEGGVNGDIVYFWVNYEEWLYAGSYVFDSGATTNLNLAVSSSTRPEPHTFYGEVLIDGVPAPDLTTVVIVIEPPDGGHFEHETYTSGGTYGVDELYQVPSDDPDTPELEGGVNGDIVWFWVNYMEDIYAGSYVFDSGATTNLDLSVSSGGGGSPEGYEILLYEGWNLIGIPFIPEDPSIEVVLSEIIDYVEAVWAFDGQTKTWSSYSPGAPSNLAEMIEDRGYWIKVNTDCILTLYP